MNYNQRYYYANLDKFQEYAHIRNHVNVTECESCGKSYRKDYFEKHKETKFHLKNEKKFNAV